MVLAHGHSVDFDSMREPSGTPDLEEIAATLGLSFLNVSSQLRWIETVLLVGLRYRNPESCPDICRVNPVRFSSSVFLSLVAADVDSFDPCKARPVQRVALGLLGRRS